MANSKEEEELRMYFQVGIEDIRYSKQQQWNTIYLTLIAIGAILGVFLAVESKGYCLAQPLPNVYITPRGFLIGICIVISSLGIMYIWRYHGDIARYRHKTRRILMEKFSADLENIADEELKLHKFLKSYLFWEKDFIWFAFPFSFLIAAAAFLVVCVVRGI